MKELTIEEKAKAYDKAIKVAADIKAGIATYITDGTPVIDAIFPELKESEDEKIWKALIEMVHDTTGDSLWVDYNVHKEEAIAWLKKQGDTNETINRDEFAQGVLRGAAINLITWIDYNAAEGNMCLSNMECKNIEDSLVNGNWDKIYAYIKKKFEKQCEQKPAWSEEDENRINRLIAYFEDKESFTAEDDIVYANWLKCLKDRYTWKPSDEQMDMLKIAVSTSNSIVLDSLYNDLMKLKE